MEANEAIKDLEDLMENLDAILDLQLEILAQDTMTYISDRWPVDTGQSKAGWSISQIDGGWSVVNPVPHTPYVHDGLAEDLFFEALAGFDLEGVLNLPPDSKT